MMRATFRCFLLLVLTFVASDVLMATAETTELTGRPIAKRPDIILFEMQPNAPAKDYQESFAKLAKRGASIPSANLTMESFSTSGIEKMLRSAGYQVVFINGHNWEMASTLMVQTLAYQTYLKSLDANAATPLCLVVSVEISPEALQPAIDPLFASEALIFLMAPSTMIPPFPLVVLWDRHVWPNHIVEHPVSPNQWLPTLAEVIGVCPPADIVAPSILPSLTGVGYQRPNDVRPTQTKSNFVTFRTYTLQPETLQYTHWLPSVEYMIPDDRQYIDGSLPLRENLLSALVPSSVARIFLIRANLKYFNLSLPETFSVVIKKDGEPVYSTWKTPIQWTETLVDSKGFEFLFFVPAMVDPQPLKVFLTNPKCFTPPMPPALDASAHE